MIEEGCTIHFQKNFGNKSRLEMRSTVQATCIVIYYTLLGFTQGQKYRYPVSIKITSIGLLNNLYNLKSIIIIIIIISAQISLTLSICPCYPLLLAGPPNYIHC